ncbi:hypothetical protein niasHT_030606 [Heterodera trifolii]|uniref:Uncharacterized protein n=1 Tax=Heterodera trifolii TaxID=157864 RepID=A0ABD2IWN5_9BILA
MLLVFLLLFSSVFTEKKCLTPTELFNSLIVGMSSSSVFSNDDQLGSTSSSDAPQNLPRIEMPLANAQMLQQWVGQVAQQIVVEDDTFAGHYSCVAEKDMKKAFLFIGLPKKQLKANTFLLGEAFQNLGNKKSDFLKMLFAFAALLSAEIGQQSFKESSFTRIFLKAYECVANKKFTENEKDFLPFSIISKIKGPIDELNVEKILLEMQSEKETKSGLADGHLQIRKDFALLSALNIEMTAGDVLEFASFVHALLNVYTKSLEYNLYMLDKMDSNTRNLFEKRFLAKNGLTIENIGQDPVKYRRIVYQLLIGLRNWDQNDLKKISEERYYQIELTMREKCVFGIFTSNLMGRMANYELLHEYFAQLFNLLFSFAVRLEAIVHGKKENGTIKEENAKKGEGEKIQIFLALLGKFNLPEWANNFRKKGQKADETKIALLNNVRYDLVMQFEFNRSKDIYDRTVNLLLEWVKTNTYDEENSEKMIENIYYFTRKTNKEKIAKIEALKEGENDGFEIGKKFDELEELVRKKDDGVKEELEKAKEELKKLEKEKRGKEKITRKKINELERQFKEQTEKLRNLAKSFGEMLEELKKHYEEKKEERSIN